MHLRPITIVLAAATAFALTACDPGTPAVTPTAAAPAATEAATSTPTAEPVVATSVYFDASIVEIRAGDDVTSFDYYADPDELVDALTLAFGFAPSATSYSGGAHVPPGVRWEWSGFEIIDPDGFIPDDETTPTFQLATSAATVGDVAIESFGDLTIGSTQAEFEALALETWEITTGERGIIHLRELSVGAEANLGNPDPGLYIQADTSDGLVTSIIGPLPNFGA